LARIDEAERSQLVRRHCFYILTVYFDPPIQASHRHFIELVTQ
jgi:hypothetical protein